MQGCLRPEYRHYVRGNEAAINGCEGLLRSRAVGF
jgi:hypothetical protein